MRLRKTLPSLFLGARPRGTRNGTPAMEDGADPSTRAPAGVAGCAPPLLGRMGELRVLAEAAFGRRGGWARGAPRSAKPEKPVDAAVRQLLRFDDDAVERTKRLSCDGYNR